MQAMVIKWPEQCITKKRLIKTMIGSIKYLHIMTHGNTTHNGSIINMINDESTPFLPNDHIFLIAIKDCYEKHKHNKNVHLEEAIVSSDMKKFSYYASKAQYVFLHCNNLSYFQILKLKKVVLNKIIWCVWGEAYLYPQKDKVSGIYRNLRRCGGNIIRYLVDRKIKNFYAIGIGFEYDALAVRKRFGNIKIVAAPYGYIKGKKKMYEEIIEKYPKHDMQLPYKIMIGHSAYPQLKHIEIMEKLYKFRDNDILISLILSYGDMEYAKMVEEYALKMFPSKVEIIRDYMSPDKYFEYLHTVDAWILDYIGQNALGNFTRLLYLQKKVFLNGESIMMLAARLESLEVYDIKDIEGLGFSEFVEPLKNPYNNKKYAESFMDENNAVIRWVNTLKDLK